MSAEHPDQRRGTVACAGPVRCIWLFDRVVSLLFRTVSPSAVRLLDKLPGDLLTRAGGEVGAKDRRTSSARETCKSRALLSGGEGVREREMSK